ncbi:MAG: nucleotidyltransferase domain-containing protein [Candidatus Heimdallarchaeota archaeon]
MELTDETNDLVESAKNSLKDIFKLYICEFAYLTGSYARNDQFTWSDIDIVISNPSYLDLPSKDKLDYLLNITTAISDALNFENIDLKILETLPLHVQFLMIKDGKLIYELDEEKTTDFVENLLQVYYDHAIWYENYLDMALSGDN